MKELKVYDITPETRVGIINLGKWLSNEIDTNGTIKDVQYHLEQILRKGYYNDKEKDLLNTLRTQYYIQKEENQEEEYL
jgi:hypothetical protein